MEPRGYRMVLSTLKDFVSTSAVAERQLYAWLDGKRYDTSALDEGRNEIAQGVTLDRDSASGRRGAYTRWRLREAMPGNEGTWQSTLVVRADHRVGDRNTWMQVDVEHRPAAPELAPKRAKTPKVAGLLLEALDWHDGLAEVARSPKFIEPEDVDEVIEELCDQDRRLPIVVASIPYDVGPARWADDVVEEAYRSLPGLAIMYVLTPRAQPAFNSALEYHPVFGGGIRTYLPGIDPAWQPDAQRHPVMSKATLRADPRKAASTLASLPQRLALRQPLPPALDSLPVQRTRPRPAQHGSDFQRLRTENETLHAMLSEAEQTEAANADEIRDLRLDRQQALRRATDAEGENDELYTQLQRMRRRVRALESRLVEAGAYDLAFAPVEEPTDYPPTFSALLSRLPELPNVAFTGNRKTTQQLDDQTERNWVETAWDALLALQDYAVASAAGTAGGDFRSWCARSSSADAHPFSAGKVKMKESDTVGNRGAWRKQRTFPVPREVHRNGRVYMEAHVRIGGGSTIAPRLHFYDDGPGTGRVYVGYLGPHLTNTRT
ncbi:hypothetical protein [Streptomyces sp. JJ38]|uniref:hypothetical protein n=1 Tax=Streptomyces sp. JJ38 TaxID=2738128 RepID=UPI00214B6B2F|nr:hypothetical protein [Streptomyces sp. JJ38]